MTLVAALTALAVAVAAGGLIGAEREQAHGARPSADFGGVRTFPLLAIVGVVGGLVRPALGAWIVGALLLSVVVALGISQIRAKSEDVGVSSELAAVVTFGLGVLTATPEIMPDRPRYLVVAGVAATTMALLALKRPLHGFIAKVSSDDVYATVKFVLLALVVIPVLPNRTFGPFEVLNPRKIGLMIALVAGVSFAGYVAARLVGERRGLLVAGLLGGLVSSTALTLSLSGRARNEPSSAELCGVGIVAGCATMFPRILVITAVVDPALSVQLWPLGVMGVAAYVCAYFGYSRAAREGSQRSVEFRNPFELRQAVQFGVLYGVVLFVARAAQHYAGTVGIFASAALSGLADVDAISISLAELHRAGGLAHAAAPAIGVAAVVNTLVKVALATTLGGRQLSRAVAPSLLLALLLGGAAFTGALVFG
ncbi:MAG TPA: MgtC/SapB family protein [Polyangiaceae bacterium]|nr:MgtC/SapB family protein [Polyangiaceae bacterium]